MEELLDAAALLEATKDCYSVRVLEVGAEREAALREGDLVFRRGNGRWSGVFAGVSGEAGYFSHVGIAVRGVDAWQVVHSDADDDTGLGGVRTDSLGHFLADAHGVAVVRPRLEPAQSARAVELARDPEWQAIPFDARFRLDDGGEAMYCTEWVQALVLAATGEDIASYALHPERVIERAVPIVAIPTTAGTGSDADIYAGI